jgi:hypothetical protein
MSETGWRLAPEIIPRASMKQSSLNPRKDGFPSYIPQIHTYDSKEVPVNAEMIGRLRANPEDRVKDHNISLLTRLIQKDLPPEESVVKGCDAGHSTSKISALVHQDFIQRYLRMDTPERGLLVYHGLGSGKTATSIAAIEANRSKKRIIVMVPASLQDNYVKEIRKIGPILFGKGAASLTPYEWYFHRIDPSRYVAIAEKANVPIELLEKNGGLFRIVRSGETDDSYIWDKMPEDMRAQLTGQIVDTLMHQVSFVRYNGLSYKAAYALDLNNAVVVIDEVHNISRMVRNKDKGIGKILYQKIRDAKNSKIIALSGTPLVNSPYELAILANMVHGSGTMVRVPFSHSRSGESASDSAIIRDLYLDPIVRYASIVPSEKAGGGDELLLMRHAMGFESMYSGDKYIGILKTERDFTKETEWVPSLSTRLRSKNIKLDHSKAKIQTSAWFPETEEEFMKMYTKPGFEGTNEYLKHEEQLLRRLMLVSYYRGAHPSKYPRTSDLRVIRTEMTDAQMEEYARERSKEILMSSKNKSAGPSEDDDTFTGRYRTRQICNAFLPDGRPTRDVVKKELEMRGIIGDDVIDEEYNRRLSDAIEKVRSTPDLRMKVGSFSPKYEKVIEILNGSEGLAIIYSSFLRMEGLELLSVFLESDGYSPFEIVLDATGNPRVKGMITEDAEERERFLRSGGRRYMTFSGAVDKELRAYLIRIYRGDFIGLPESLLGDISEILGDSYTDDSTGNLRGQLCRILMITGAGAEGLDLKAVRQVHVLEPYWNQARLDQVFGRAVRVCSHADLDDAERDVERYLHVCAFPTDTYREMVSRGDNRFLESGDNGMSTDEYLADLSKRKTDRNKAFLRLLMRSAVDCTLHASDNGISLTECITMPALASKDDRIGVSPDYKDDADDNEIREELRDTIIIQVGKSVIRDDSTGAEIDVGPMVVGVDYRTMNAYDPDMIVLRKLKRIGHVELTDDDTPMAILVLEQDVPKASSMMEGVVSSSLSPSPSRSGESGSGAGGDAGGADGGNDGAPPDVKTPPDSGRGSGSGEGVDDAIRRLVGGVKSGTRFVVANEDELSELGRSEYTEFLSEYMEDERENIIEKIVDKYTNELIPLMMPSSGKKSRTFVLVMGHPGSGKTHFTQELLDNVIITRMANKVFPFITREDKGDIVSIPMIREPLDDITLEYDDYARVGVDEILVYMKEYQERLIVGEDGMIKKVDPRVIGDRTLRNIANRVSLNLFMEAMDNQYPIIYETTFANPKRIMKDILKPAMENGYISRIHEGEGEPAGGAAAMASAAGGGEDPPRGALVVSREGREREATVSDRVYPYGGQMIVFNFYNRSLTKTKSRVRERFEKEGRYLKIDGGDYTVVGMWNESKTKRTKGEYRNILTARGKSRYKLDLPVDLYLEIDTTNESNAQVDYNNAIVNIGFMRSERNDKGLYSDMIRLS